MESKPLGVIDYPPMPPRTAPCEKCEGKGVTKSPHQLDTPRYILPIDEICPDCSGCGDADHAECTPYDHADPDVLGIEPPDDSDQPPVCLSCMGRRWYPLECRRDVDDAHSQTLRMPCGCAEEMVRPA